MQTLPWILVTISTLLYFGMSSAPQSSSYFEVTYGKDTSGRSVTMEFLECDRTESCTNVVKKRGGQYLIVNGERELKSHKDVECIWKKNKAPGWKDCSDVKTSGNVKNGIYTIKTSPFADLSVFCDLSTDNTGWIVIQRRVDGTTDFDRNWAEYKKGFGDINGNYWMGLDNMHLLAMPGRGAKLRIDMKHKDKPTELFYAQYEKFEIASEAEKYRLSVGGYSGTAGDSLIQCTGHFQSGCSSGMMFTTKDNDNDEASFNCAITYPGAWWHKRCFNGNLNLRYNQQGSGPQYMTWYTLRNSFGGLIYSEMKIKYQ